MLYGQFLGSSAIILLPFHCDSVMAGWAARVELENCPALALGADAPDRLTIAIATWRGRSICRTDGAFVLHACSHWNLGMFRGGMTHAFCVPSAQVHKDDPDS